MELMSWVVCKTWTVLTLGTEAACQADTWCVAGQEKETPWAKTVGLNAAYVHGEGGALAAGIAG